MSRQRNISPTFFLDADLGTLPPLARLLFAGLWTIADREGRLEDRPDRIKRLVLPHDDCDVHELLRLLATKPGRFIIRYRVERRRFIQIRNFPRYQHVHPKEAKSRIPAPPNAQKTKDSASGAVELRGLPDNSVASREKPERAGRNIKPSEYQDLQDLRNIKPSVPPTGRERESRVMVRAGRGPEEDEKAIISSEEKQAAWRRIRAENSGMSERDQTMRFVAWMTEREKESRGVA
jgi:hypothetical protein